MFDRVEGIIRDSDIKFQCRILLTVIQIIKLPKELEDELIQPIHEIVKLENKRLDAIKSANS